LNFSTSTFADVLVIGAGIAGAGAAYELAEFASVTILEAEARYGYHATGRSAASFSENYGNTLVRRLAIGSRSFLSKPPAGFSDHSLLRPRGMITIARSDQLFLLEREMESARALIPTIRSMSRTEAIRRVPILREDYLAGAFLEPDSMEVDVHALHHGFLRAARHRGARFVANARVKQVERTGGQWRVESPQGRFCAPILVNASGAWGDEIATMSGITPLGLVAKRRTAFNIPIPQDVITAGWPLVNDVGGEFYFKPDAGQLFVSPSDATPCAPMDAYPDDLDVAVGVERLERATTLTVEHVSHSWAGLRTFVADSSPAVGPDASVASFIWLVGQGGYGIKTSPALSRICAALVAQKALPDDLLELGITASDLSPNRLQQAYSIHSH
jgi:D-arginine dehydrogenase